MKVDKVSEKDENDLKEILVFALGEPFFALYLSGVERVVRAVETTPLPKAPQFVAGVINMQGQVIPVVDIRPYFGLAAPEINQNNRFILVRTARRLLALVVDSGDRYSGINRKRVCECQSGSALRAICQRSG